MHFCDDREACFSRCQGVLNQVCALLEARLGFFFLPFYFYFSLFVFLVSYITRDLGDITDNYIALLMGLDASMSFFQVSVPACALVLPDFFPFYVLFPPLNPQRYS